MLVHLMAMITYVLPFSLFYVNGDRVHPLMPKRPIDGYCDAWTQFEDTGFWEDDWDSIDLNDHLEVDDPPIISKSPSNIYDTYYAHECRRIRRPWNTMSHEDRQLYIDGLLELRHRGELKMEKDEFVAIASVHDDHFGSVTHHDSDYMFWHGYLVWELESRIRNLGGRFKCFGMPYWDITNEWYNEDDIPAIYQTGLGGYGDPDDAWKVNGYSWDVTTKQFWSPDHNFACTASDDKCPICSVKRELDDSEVTGFPGMHSAEYYGEKMMDLPDFIDFQQWMVKDVGLPHSIDNSYDPIWYLFHSFESYMQAMWVNCNDYDLIDDLKKSPSAFSPYCDPNDDHIDLTMKDCVGIGLDNPLYFDGLLPKREWSYVHNNELDIKKLYSLPQWNIIYDLNDDQFWTRSGLDQKCKNKLNKEWFILPSTNNDEYQYKEIVTENNSFLNGFIPSNIYQLSMIAIILLFCIIFTVWKINGFRNRQKEHSKLLNTEYDNLSVNGGYGSV